MKLILSEHNVALADWARFGSTAAVSDMSIVVNPPHFSLTVVTPLGLLQTVLLVTFQFGLRESVGAPLTSHILVKFLDMLLFIVHIDELPALLTTAYVPAAV